MKGDMDFVVLYGRALGWNLRPKTVLVEGTTDVDLFQLAASLERSETGIDLLGGDLAIEAAGVGDRGGTRGVVRELISLRNFGRTCLLPDGRPRYRFVGLFDNDCAGRQAVKLARVLDASVMEYKDVFRIQPVMPTSGNLDPRTLQRNFERSNSVYKGLDWELEDLLPREFLEAFFSENPNSCSKKLNIGEKVHHDFSRDGKARLHRFIREHAMYDDLGSVIDVLKAIRFYLCL
jgi:hypothetical protein